MAALLSTHNIWVSDDDNLTAKSPLHHPATRQELNPGSVRLTISNVHLQATGSDRSTRYLLPRPYSPESVKVINP
jgi:hypothetical protein